MTDQSKKLNQMMLENMTDVIKYLKELSDRLDLVSDTEDYDVIEKEALEVVEYADELNNYRRNNFLAKYSEDFYIALGGDLEHISGYAQELAEKSVKCKEEAEEEASEHEAHVRAYSVPSI